MSLGRRQCERQDTFWVVMEKLDNGPRNVFFDRLNRLLAEIDFDRKLEKAAEPYYQKTGRKGLPPGVYFRMIFIGYFEDISSQRGIAWRCDDIRSLARFLGYAPSERMPDHSTLSLTRERLPMEVHALAGSCLAPRTARLCAYPPGRFRNSRQDESNKRSQHERTRKFPLDDAGDSSTVGC